MADSGQPAQKKQRTGSPPAQKTPQSGQNQRKTRSANKFNSPQEACPKIVRAQNSRELPQTRAACNGEFALRIQQLAAARAALRLPVIQQVLTTSSVDTKSEADFRLHVNSLLTTCTLLGTPEKTRFSEPGEEPAEEAEDGSGEADAKPAAGSGRAEAAETPSPQTGDRGSVDKFTIKLEENIAVRRRICDLMCHADCENHAYSRAVSHWLASHTADFA